MKTLNDLLDERKQLKEAMDIGLGGDPRTMSGRLTAKREAEERYEQNILNYQQRVRQCMAMVLLVSNSDEKEKQAKVVAQEMGAIVLTANEVFDQIGVTIEGTVASEGVFTSGCYGGLENSMFALMRAYQLEGDVSISYENLDVPVKTFAQLRDIIRNTVRPFSVTNELRVAVAATKLSAEAQRLEISEEPVPVVIYGFESDNDAKEFQKRFFPDRPSVVGNLDTAANAELEVRKAAAELSKKLGI